jgi:hypothetical protein
MEAPANAFRSPYAALYGGALPSTADNLIDKPSDPFPWIIHILNVLPRKLFSLQICVLVAAHVNIGSFCE